MLCVFTLTVFKKLFKTKCADISPQDCASHERAKTQSCLQNIVLRPGKRCIVFLCPRENDPADGEEWIWKSVRTEVSPLYFPNKAASKA